MHTHTHTRKESPTPHALLTTPSSSAFLSRGRFLGVCAALPVPSQLNMRKLVQRSENAEKELAEIRESFERRFMRLEAMLETALKVKLGIEPPSPSPASTSYLEGVMNSWRDRGGDENVATPARASTAMASIGEGNSLKA